MLVTCKTICNGSTIEKLFFFLDLILYFKIMFRVFWLELGSIRVRKRGFWAEIPSSTQAYLWKKK